MRAFARERDVSWIDFIEGQRKDEVMHQHLAALGLQWTDIDLDDYTLMVRRSRLRPKWRYGCGEPCGHKFGGYCPQRWRYAGDSRHEVQSGKRGIGYLMSWSHYSSNTRQNRNAND